MHSSCCRKPRDPASRRTRVAYWAGGALLAFAALLVYRPGPLADLRNWGVHFATYFPAAAQALFWFCALLVLVSSRARGLLASAAAAWGGCLAGPTDSRLRRRAGDVIVALALTAVFWLVRSRYALLGDNWLRLEQATRGTALPYEWGTLRLAHLAITAARAAWGWDPRTTLAVVNTLAGFPFVLATVWIARSLASQAAARGAVHLALLSWAGLELFCGYIEVYSWAAAALALYLAALLHALRGGSRVWPWLVFVLAAGLHAVALLFALPLVLITWRPSADERAGTTAWSEPRHVRRAAGALLLCAAVSPLLFPGLLYGYQTARPGELTLLSPALWWERLQGLLLATPAGTLIGLPLLIAALAGARRLSPPQLTLAAAAWPVLLGLLPMRMVLGAADWDILSLAGLPLLVWTAGWFTDPSRRLSWSARDAGERGWRLLVPLALFLSLVNTAGFVAVNASSAAVARIRTIVRDDPAPYYRDHPPPVHLSMIFGLNDLLEPCRAVLLDAIAEHPQDPRLAHNLASVYFQERRWAEARNWARRALEILPGYFPSVRLLYLVAVEEGDGATQLALGEMILASQAQDPALVARYFDSEEQRALRERVAAWRARLQPRPEPPGSGGRPSSAR